MIMIHADSDEELQQRGTKDRTPAIPGIRPYTMAKSGMTEPEARP